MGKIADLSLLNPIYEYLPYCAVFREEYEEGTHKKVVVTEYVKTYPPFPWIRDGENAHEEEDPTEFINACAEAGLVRWETKEQEKERLSRERLQEMNRPMSWEEYQNHMKIRNGENV